MSNRSGTTFSAPTDANRNRVLLGVSEADGETPLALEINPNTGRALVDAEVTVSPAELPAALVNNQQTVTASAAALPSGTLTQGVILESLSSNTVSVFVGGAGVTTSTGYELQPGASVGIAVNNTDAIYVVCATGSPVVTWIGS